MKIEKADIKKAIAILLAIGMRTAAAELKARDTATYLTAAERAQIIDQVNEEEQNVLSDDADFGQTLQEYGYTPVTEWSDAELLGYVAGSWDDSYARPQARAAEWRRLTSPEGIAEEAERGRQDIIKNTKAEIDRLQRGLRKLETEKKAK